MSVRCMASCGAVCMMSASILHTCIHTHGFIQIHIQQYRRTHSFIWIYVHELICRHRHSFIEIHVPKPICRHTCYSLRLCETVHRDYNNHDNVVFCSFSVQPQGAVAALHSIYADPKWVAYKTQRHFDLLLSHKVDYIMFADLPGASNQSVAVMTALFNNWVGGASLFVNVSVFGNRCSTIRPIFDIDSVSPFKSMAITFVRATPTTRCAPFQCSFSSGGLVSTSWSSHVFFLSRWSSTPARVNDSTIIYLLFPTQTHTHSCVVRF